MHRDDGPERTSKLAWVRIQPNLLYHNFPEVGPGSDMHPSGLRQKTVRGVLMEAENCCVGARCMLAALAVDSKPMTAS